MAKLAELSRQSVDVLALMAEEKALFSAKAVIGVTYSLLVLAETLERRADEVKSDTQALELGACVDAYQDAAQRLLRLLGLKVVTAHGERHIVEESWRR